MKLEKATTEEIRRLGVEALAKELGPVGMARFLRQFDVGTGDYTRERARWTDETTLHDAVEEIKRRRDA